ncbi:hypothetical protein K2X33_02790 [bacterium]|nr:hypothetical protein [bacterium]
MKSGLLALFFSISFPLLGAEDATLTKLTKAFKDTAPPIQQKVERKGDKTLEVESLLEIAGDLASFEMVAKDLPHWRDWAFEKINNPGEGQSDYIVQLHDAVSKAPEQMTALFSFNLPFFGKNRTRSFHIQQSKIPAGYRIQAESLLNTNSALKSAKVVADAYLATTKKNMLWVAIHATVVFKSWLIYEALPEKVVLRELGDRLSTIVANFETESTRRKRGGPGLPARPMPPAESLNED